MVLHTVLCHAVHRYIVQLLRGQYINTCKSYIIPFLAHNQSINLENQCMDACNIDSLVLILNICITRPMKTEHICTSYIFLQKTTFLGHF